jgi:MFS family permease
MEEVQKVDRVLLQKDFFALFKILSLGALNDNILKNAFMVLLAFSGYTIFNLPQGQLLNIAAMMFILPYLIFSSYAGKIADSSDKARIIRIIKLCEIIIMLIAALGFIYHQIMLLLLCLFFMGTHSAFFGPLKYSIVPQYLPRKSLVMANGYIEMGTFAAILLGQAIGSWFMANGYMDLVIAIMLLVSITGYYFSRELRSVEIINHQVKFYKNVVKDSWTMYKAVSNNKLIRLNLHAISWFWALGIVFSTQFPILTLHYIGGDAHVFSVLLIIFTLGIGFGSLICAKLSHASIKHKYVIIGALLMSVGYFILLVMHRHNINVYPHWKFFLQTPDGLILIITCLLIGLAAGFYSVTCYNEIQLISPDSIRSQIISANNILNAVYMVGASLISSILLTFISVWWLLMLLAILNLLFIVIYSLNLKSAVDNSRAISI